MASQFSAENVKLFAGVCLHYFLKQRFPTIHLGLHNLTVNQGRSTHNFPELEFENNIILALIKK